MLIESAKAGRWLYD
ncbi:DUF1493 family protein [Yersinia similis]